MFTAVMQQAEIQAVLNKQSTIETGEINAK